MTPELGFHHLKIVKRRILTIWLPTEVILKGKCQVGAVCYLTNIGRCWDKFKCTCDTVAMYLRNDVDLIRSAWASPGHACAVSLNSLVPVNGVFAFSLANTNGLDFGTFTSSLVAISKSIARLQSGGRRIYASTFFRDFPAAITISILNT
jgi:hypothetical protein